MAFCNNNCGCGKQCGRQDDHGGDCKCGYPNHDRADPRPLSLNQRTRIERELNKLIGRCLWKPAGDPSKPLLRRAAAAYVLLKHHGMTVEAQEDVVLVLTEGNAYNTNFLKD